MLWGWFSAAGTEGLVRIEKKLNAPKYWDSLNENTVQSRQNLRLGRRFTLQRDNDPKHTPGLEPSQIFLEKPENVHLPPSNLKEFETWRDEEKNGR